MEQIMQRLDEMERLLRQMYVLAYCSAQENCPDERRQLLQATLERLRREYQRVSAAAGIHGAGGGAGVRYDC